MPDILLAALETAGLGWMILTTLVAGVVYGFAGFGAGLIFMPIAAAFVTPATAIAAFAVSALASVVTVFPRALPLVDRKAVGVLIVSATVAASFGIWVLRVADTTVIRWFVVSTCAITLVALIAGWRHAVAPRLTTRIGIGLATGFVGGISGLLGPIMVLFQLAGRDAIATTRATTLVFLTITSLLLLPLMYLQGILTAEAVALGLVMLVPYGMGALVGQALFLPDRERSYRVAAYVIIAAATLMGLPIWDRL
ncbi:sulfite exporter TauE/SafE family protein [Marivita sp.]|uniref:sulfite exporter TauE/SafE family protein n=1 Tax=Marivita sp. TaxID=2003365 RepID=UPI0025BDFEDA|nr:sulfite exporter TauE/SafE family protein [Marivita sp.]